MSESNDKPLFGKPVRAIDEAGQLIERMFDVARTDAVFGAPLTQGDATVIVVSELTVGMGVGFGSGEGNEEEGSGGGGGGGGYALGRPVAVVSIDTQGVRVQPIFDLTKVAIAAITALGAMAIAYRQMARAADKA
ncbi:MAG TPA: spore germination protein GerW family protein [Caldilinea sp.]|nr:hypothetical protein [Anaerolineales bacterium]HRA69035.1 spore germination protein GerW family protein [Caldilinea sp.]